MVSMVGNIFSWIEKGLQKSYSLFIIWVLIVCKSSLFLEFSASLFVPYEGVPYKKNTCREVEYDYLFFRKQLHSFCARKALSLSTFRSHSWICPGQHPDLFRNWKWLFFLCIRVLFPSSKTPLIWFFCLLDLEIISCLKNRNMNKQQLYPGFLNFISSRHDLQFYENRNMCCKPILHAYIC